jgi:hypothetical protein
MRAAIFVGYFFGLLGRPDDGLAAFFKTWKKSPRLGCGMAIVPFRTVGLFFLVRIAHVS